MRHLIRPFFTLALLAAFLTGCGTDLRPPLESLPAQVGEVITLETLPEYAGEPYVELYGNQPAFPAEDRTTASFEQYSQLDYFGRCGVAYANVSQDTMPTEERGSIGQVKPSGWHTVKYDFIDGKYLYNRCHLLGYQLTGENANELNLITGTRYLNVSGMLPFEEEVARYVRQTGGHVLYRVTPIYQGAEPVARGVEMEAWSVEDEGAEVCFHIFAYNVQPGVVIDYATGESWAEGQSTPAPSPSPIQEPSSPVPTAPSGGEPSSEVTVEETYLLNTKSGKFHTLDCSGGKKTAEHNRQLYTGTYEDLLAAGYTPCGSCLPQEK